MKIPEEETLEAVMYSAPLSETEALAYHPLSLAFIGDSVYENYVRERILRRAPRMVPRELHLQAIRYVKASSQSRIVEELEPLFTEQEHYVYKRGRNTKSGTVPKNADVLDYRRASGFEALIGYLYLTGNTARLQILIDHAFTVVEGENHD
jgi:ribonuclease-3 family protein